MEANLARADQQARKHAAKLEAKEKARAERQQALDAAGVPKQAATKHVKKIVATADKRRDRMRQPQPGARLHHTVGSAPTFLEAQSNQSEVQQLEHATPRPCCGQSAHSLQGKAAGRQARSCWSC